MNNIRDAIFRFFLKPYCFRRMTIFLLAHPKKTNIIRTRERIIRIFPQTHTHAHTRKKGNVMYILLLLVFPRRAASHRTNSQQQKRSSSAVATPSSSVRSCFFLLSFVFQSIEENCQIFLLSVFLFLGQNANQPAKLFLLPFFVWPPHNTQPRTEGSLSCEGLLLLEFSWENLTVFPLGWGHPTLKIFTRGAPESVRLHRTALGVTSRTLARPTSTHNRVGNLPQQSDVCDVTFPKNDCCSLSPYNTLACAHSFPFFPFFSGGPLLLYPYRTDDEDEDISELPAESGVASSLLLSSLA